MLSRLKKAKSSEEGFTLVELIVVLVILAILAALLIPALTGYIDKAREKQIIAETRQVVQAAQTIFDEEYAKAYITLMMAGEKLDLSTESFQSSLMRMTVGSASMWQSRTRLMNIWTMMRCIISFHRGKERRKNVKKIKRDERQ